MKKKSLKLNIVDVIIIAVLLIAVAYAVYAVAVNMQKNMGVADVEYVIEVAEIRNDLADNIAEGQAVYNLDGEYMGTVSSISVAQAYHEGADHNGNPVYSKIDGYNTLYVTVECQANVKASGYELGGDYLAAGNDYALRSPSLYFEGECVSVQKTEK